MQDPRMKLDQLHPTGRLYTGIVLCIFNGKDFLAQQTTNFFSFSFSFFIDGTSFLLNAQQAPMVEKSELGFRRKCQIPQDPCCKLCGWNS